MNPGDLLEHAVALFGSAPADRTLNDQFVRQAERHPETVRSHIERIANKHRNGEITSPWGVMRSELQKLANVNKAAKQGNAKEKAYERAAQWMRAAGLHYDRYSEIHDELFGERGQLREHVDLEQRIEALWSELRPKGEQVEREAEERQARYAEQRTIPRKPAVKEAA